LKKFLKNKAKLNYSSKRKSKIQN
jgi:hypothetical protein